MTKEYNIRKRMSQEDNLVEMLTAAGDDQASIVAFATQKGFIRFDMDTMKMAWAGTVQPHRRPHRRLVGWCREVSELANCVVWGHNWSRFTAAKAAAAVKAAATAAVS